MNEQCTEYFNQARQLFGLGKFEESLVYIDKAIEEEKMNPELYIYRGIALTNLEKFDEAIEEFGKSVKIDKKYAEAYFHTGNVMIMKGDRSEGLSYYNKAIGYGYDGAQIYYNLGLYYEEDGNEELALRNYSKAILANPQRVDARVRKVQLYISHGQYEEALDDVNELILVDPDLFEGYHLKASILSELGKLQEAKATLEEAQKLFPKDASFALDKVGLYVLNGKIDLAKGQINEIVAKFELSDAQKRQLALEKARIFAVEEKLDKVAECLTEAKNIEKNLEDADGEVTFLLSNCYLEQKDYRNALAMAKELTVADDPLYSIPAYYTLAYAYANLGIGDETKVNAIYKDSIAKLRKITLDTPELVDAYFFRALCHKDIKEFDKANDLCDFLIKANPDNPNYHALKAEILGAMGDTEGAEKEKKIAESL